MKLRKPLPNIPLNPTEVFEDIFKNGIVGAFGNSEVHAFEFVPAGSAGDPFTRQLWEGFVRYIKSLTATASGDPSRGVTLDIALQQNQSAMKVRVTIEDERVLIQR
jgi:hypothetical protein